jgi:hypothetical protein
MRLGGPYDFMRRALQSERGQQLFSKRCEMIEPVVAQIKANRRVGRFNAGAGPPSARMAPDRDYHNLLNSTDIAWHWRQPESRADGPMPFPKEPILAPAGRSARVCADRVPWRTAAAFAE